jgi:hypothetical protein
MRKKIAVVALAGGIGLTGGMLIAPSIATAADSGSSTSVSGRLGALKDALKSLVTDGTLTQAQADKVATTLDQKLPRRGPGGPGFPGRMGMRGGPAHLEPADIAKALGITVNELRTQSEAGKTLAQIAASKGISKSALIDKLVTAAEAELAQAVKNGRITQAQADTIKGTLKPRITEMVDKVGPAPRMGHHHGGMMGPDDDDAPSGTPAQPSSTGANA